MFMFSEVVAGDYHGDHHLDMPWPALGGAPSGCVVGLPWAGDHSRSPGGRESNGRLRVYGMCGKASRLKALLALTIYSLIASSTISSSVSIFISIATFTAT